MQYDAYGSADGLAVRTVPTPSLRPGSVLVRVIASPVEAADILIRSGRAKIVTGREFPRGVGFDFTGDVVEVADDVRDFRLGDPVWGFLPSNKLLPTGAVAERVLIPVSHLARRPATVDPVQAAALPGVGGAVLTVFHAIALKAGERVLIRGAAGGVGLAAVQIARYLGADVTGLASAKDLDRVRSAGASQAVDYRTVDVSTLGRFDVILDTVGTGMGAFRRRLGRGGRMVAMTPGSPVGLVYIKLTAIFGGRRIRFLQAPPDGPTLRELTEVVERGGVRPIVDRVFDMDAVAQAHRAEEARAGFGRRIVRVAAPTGKV